MRMNFEKRLLANALTVAAICSASASPDDGEMLIPSTTTVNVPVDVDGTLMDVPRKVPYEPLDVDYRVFTKDFLISQGAVTPIHTFKGDVLSVLDSLTPAQVQAFLANPGDVTTNDVESEK